MRARQNDMRLYEREYQTRSFAAPLPDFSSLPRANESVRVRAEWETRDTMNNRLFSDIMVTGPKAVTSAMLASHPSAGAETFMPSAARQDQRSYVTDSYFPDSRTSERGRTMLPPRSLNQNQYTASLDIDGDPHNTVRELQSSVKEDTRFTNEDTGIRIMERVFTHQWVPAELTRTIVETQLLAAERLRPQGDDYTKTVRPR